MPAKRIYTDEQRRRAHDMYWKGREDPMEGIRAKGDYTLREIQQITGVSIAMAWYIARGIK